MTTKVYNGPKPDHLSIRGDLKIVQLPVNRDEAVFLGIPKQPKSRDLIDFRRSNKKTHLN